MFCSTVIPTVGRASLGRAVESVLAQSLEVGEFEVIVVNDSGTPLPFAHWQQSDRVRVTETCRRERSVARNVGAAMARGRYLHFLDDDDWLLPGALRCFQQLASMTGAAWLYGGFRLVDHSLHTTDVRPDEAGNCLIEMVASEWIPLQASVISARAFFGTGGFAPLPSLGGGYEDIDLARRIAIEHDFAGTPTLVAGIRVGEQNSSTNYRNVIEQNRISREKTLDWPGAFARMRHSARSRAMARDYWHGRMVYYYAASARRNLRDRRGRIACSRGAHLLAALAVSIPYLASPQFWRAISTPHFNRVRTALGDAGPALYPSASDQ